jgi:hypothetical protein
MVQDLPPSAHIRAAALLALQIAVLLPRPTAAQHADGVSWRCANAALVLTSDGALKV